MKNIKRKVKNAVDLYKQTFQKEYNQVVVEIQQARQNQITEWGEAVTEDGSSHAIKRELFRVPETLYNLIIANLSDEEVAQMDTDEYSKWFLKEFPQFRMTKDE